MIQIKKDQVEEYLKTIQNKVDDFYYLWKRQKEKEEVEKQLS